MAYYREYEDYGNQREYDDRRGYDKNRGYDTRRDSNNRGAGHRSPHRKMMSREKAENILDVEARFRDFWYLDNGEDNRDRLQDAIDVVYNTVPGNDYVIDYMECQNSCRLKVKCLTCNVELTGYDPFITHEKGKPHKKVRQQIICIKDPNIKAELTKQPHNLTKGIFEPNSLEDMIDHCKETILGVHFLYKEVRERPYFTCTLCLKEKGSKVSTVSSNKMYKHLLGTTHNKKYMSVKFGISQRNGFQNILLEYERFEGKIHAPIIDFTNQMVLATVKKEEIKMEPETKFKPFPVKRERSDSEESTSGRSRKKLIRTPSPAIFMKTEIISPTASPIRELPQVMAPIREFPQVMAPASKDAETMTENPRSSSPIFQLLEESANLKLPGACNLLQEDPFMVRLLCDGLIELNRKKAVLFKDQGVMCWDFKGEVVNKAYDCAMDLERKHLLELKAMLEEML
ncbi:uncharacterized protein LOC135209113 [Macrobrachium nipponense]|uniref:uncharacterized protein LOC135209113 n=1 Tax=Macrobrachium nipponense TaxID=159736 RepID=UPI0030C80E61